MAEYQSHGDRKERDRVLEAGAILSRRRMHKYKEQDGWNDGQRSCRKGFRDSQYVQSHVAL